MNFYDRPVRWWHCSRCGKTHGWVATNNNPACCNDSTMTEVAAWTSVHPTVRLIDAGFDPDTAARLAKAGYTVLGYSPLPLSALTGVQG